MSKENDVIKEVEATVEENVAEETATTNAIKITSKLVSITIFEDEEGDTCSLYFKDEFDAFKQSDAGEYVRVKRHDFSMYFKQFIRALPELEVLYNLNATDSGIHDNKRDEKVYRSILVGASVTFKRTFVPRHVDAESGEQVRDQYYTEVLDIKLSSIGNKMLERFIDKAVDNQYQA